MLSKQHFIKLMLKFCLCIHSFFLECLFKHNFKQVIYTHNKSPVDTPTIGLPWFENQVYNFSSFCCVSSKNHPVKLLQIAKSGWEDNVFTVQSQLILSITVSRQYSPSTHFSNSLDKHDKEVGNNNNSLAR